MPRFQVTSRELVYIDRTYEVEADDIDAAKHEAKERNGEQVDEQIGETCDFVRIISAEELPDDQPSAAEACGILKDH